MTMTAMKRRRKRTPDRKTAALRKTAGFVPRVTPRPKTGDVAVHTKHKGSLMP